MYVMKLWHSSNSIAADDTTVGYIYVVVEHKIRRFINLPSVTKCLELQTNVSS